MSTRIEVAPWNWAGLAPRRRTRAGRQELWAGAVYLLVWSVLWLAVVVTVLAPLDGFFGAAQ